MSSLLDQAIKVGQELEGSEQRKAALTKQIAEIEDTLKARQQELAKLERESAQRIKAEQTTWEQTQRDQEVLLKNREADIEAQEAALKDFPDQAQALKDREAAVAKAEAHAATQWQKAKQAELDWQARNAELDAKAAAINQLKPSVN